MKWEQWEIDYLKEKYQTQSVEKTAKALNRTASGVNSKASALGIAKRNNSRHRKWTQKELEYLEDSWGTISIESIATNLGRTKDAVQLKASRIGLGAFLEAGDYISLNVLYRALRKESSGSGYTLNQWIEKGLPVKTKEVKGSSFKVINLDDFWKWAEKNRTIIDFSQLEENILGKEPDWLPEQRRADKKMAKFKKTPWTETEDRRLRNLLREFKYSYRELSEILNRTEGAIKRRILDLGYKERPVKMPNHNPWTAEEVNIVIELFNKGYQPDIMTRHINRSAQAIRGKIERMIKEGELEPRSEYRKSC